MASWAQTQGTILSGTLVSGDSYDQSSSSYQTYHEPVVTYQYEVNGAQYTGSRITQMPLRYGSSSDAQKYLTEHSVGSTVTVYYDPMIPANAFLEKGLGSAGQKQLMLAGGVLGGIFAAFGGLAVVMIAFTLIVICLAAIGAIWLLNNTGFGF